MRDLMDGHSELFRDLCSSGLTPGAAPLTIIAEAESRLGVTFPDEYRDFLGEFGALLAQGIEIYGLLSLELNDPPMWQSVVEVTQNLKEMKQAGTERTALVPVSDDGMGVYFFMDTTFAKNAEVLAIGPGVERKVANKLDEFALALASGTLEY
jgi:hypothetical protein